MAQKSNEKKASDLVINPFAPLEADPYKLARKGCAHIYGNGYRCATDELGYKSPKNRSPAEIVVDASEGFIPLWAKDVTLRWRFNENSFLQFANPNSAKLAVRKLMSESLLLWGDSVPIKFAERSDAWDFEVIVKEQDDCDINGCVLASAFFPDSGRHQLVVYPKTFEQPTNEQIETIAHELGHIFGLRHFFAQLKETAWASEIFGEHSPFSIMNYGEKSRMTEQDHSDLKLLYSSAWSGELTNINGTSIRLVKPYHML